MNAINVVGNAIGVFVLHAGVAGVAYLSLISRIFAAVAMLILAMNRNNPLTIWVRQVFAWNPRMIIRIFRIAIPNSVENGLFQIAKVALSSIVAMFVQWHAGGRGCKVYHVRLYLFHRGMQDGSFCAVWCHI